MKLDELLSLLHNNVLNVKFKHSDKIHGQITMEHELKGEEFVENLDGTFRCINQIEELKDGLIWLFIQKCDKESITFLDDHTFRLDRPEIISNKRKNPPCQKGLDLIEKAGQAIANLEKFLKTDEELKACFPLYKVRCILHEVSNEYMANRNVCNRLTTFDLNYDKE